MIKKIEIFTKGVFASIFLAISMSCVAAEKNKKIEVKKDFYTHISFGDVSFDGCLITSKQVMFPIKNFKYWRIDDANNLNIFFDDGNGISKVIINKNNDVINIFKERYHNCILLKPIDK